LSCNITLETGITGSESITLSKSSGMDEPYTLEIINNNKVFVYDENGISPTNEKNLNPMIIEPLSF
jgi:hypothetical protein